jgi:hypothetical protein
MTSRKKLRPGDTVRVLNFDEIAATLDGDGCLDHMPFMPEMRAFCGRRFTVRHRLNKTCVEGYGARLLHSTVTLQDVYCDGSGHDGCQRSCPVFWKEAWLRTVETGPGAGGGESPAQPGPDVALRTRKDEEHYFCQSTELGRATTYLFPISLTRCTAEVQAGNVSLRQGIRFLWVPFVVKLKTKLLGLGSVQPVGREVRTSAEVLNLQPGELVEVKSPPEISLMLDQRGRNRGLEFTPTMLPFCGKRYRVKSRVEKMILETTGEMREIHNTVILEGVTCDGHTILGGCSRHVFHLWREAWLRRVEGRPDS